MMLYSLAFHRNPSPLHGVRRNLDFLVMLSAESLQFVVIPVPEPSVKLMNDEQSGHHSSDNQQDIERRVLPDVRKPNINVHMSIRTVRPSAPIKLSDFSFAKLLIMRHAVTSCVHRLHIASGRAARLVPDTAQSRSDLLLFHLLRIGFVVLVIARALRHRLHLHLIRNDGTFVRLRFGVVIDTV